MRRAQEQACTDGIVAMVQDQQRAPYGEHPQHHSAHLDKYLPSIVAGAWPADEHQSPLLTALHQSLLFMSYT